MKKLLVFALFLQTALIAQDFKIEYDYARFNYSDTSGYVEIYYSFYQPALMAVQNADEFSTKGILTIRFRNILDTAYAVNKDFQFTNVILDTAQLNKSLTGNLGFVLPLGSYETTIVGRDGNNLTVKDSVSFQIDIDSLPADRFSISDIELAGSIKQSDNKDSQFYKNTYEVVPNPSGVYGEGLPVLYFYSEIYNINKNSESDFLHVRHLLLNSSNRTIYHKDRSIASKAASIVEAGAIPINKYPSGTYMLVLTVSDSVRNITIYSSKKLFIYNPSVTDTAETAYMESNVLSSEFAAMGEEEVDETFAFSKYVATSQEADQWETLTDIEAKRAFLFNFWKARDLNVSTPVNENKRDYFNRVRIANEKFGTMQRKGWKTDRGRVFITYGEPSEIERYPNQVDTKPYEIWQYNQLEGGVIFVFADLSGFSDYQLLHSSLRGELRDDNWQRKISTY